MLGCDDATVPPPVPTGAPGPDAGPAICATHAFADHGAARVFAVQPRITPDTYATYEAFRAHLRGLVDREVAPCLATGRPNVIVFPEYVGLAAGFIGSRAAEARTKPGATAAFLALSQPYKQAIDYYTDELGTLGLAQGLLLALTDTLWRAFAETMSEIATTTGATVIASTLASGSVDKSSDPAAVAALSDPDLPDSTYVYVAADAAIYNAAYVFEPSGEIVARARKPYLVELEEGQLSLTYGALSELAPIAIGDLSVGVVTSKDAWMPDVVGRLASLGANVLVQPEAFEGWTTEQQPGDWLPDVFRQSSWAATQKEGGVRYAFVPHLTGNLFDLAFDGQSAVIADGVPGELVAGYIGQAPQGGFVDVAPWVAPDPGLADPSLPLDDRRSALRAVGKELLPGGARDNEYVETVVAADVDPESPFPIATAGPAGVLGPSAALDDTELGDQSRPALAFDGGARVYAVWQDDRDGRPRIYFAASDDGGASFGAAKPVAASAQTQLDPAICVHAGSVVVAFVERDGGGGRVLAAVSTAGGASFAPPVAVNAAATADADEWRPSVASDGTNLYVALVESIAGNERVRVARSLDGASFELVHADATPPSKPAPNTRNNQWAPSIAARPGEIAVAWTDFRNYQWDIFLSRSTDSGVNFSAAERIDDGSEAPERLNDDPLLAWGPGDVLLAAWTDVRLRKTPSKARAARVSGTAVEASRVLGAAPDEASAWRPRLALVGTKLVAAWQDDRALGNDIYLATSSDGGATWAAEARVDDGGEGPSYQTWPAIAASASDVVIAWEDTRSGRRRVRYVAGSP